MAQNLQYIAWLNGCSVARGPSDQVRRAAIAIFNTERWRETVTDCGKPTVLRITKGARQTTISEETLTRPDATVVIDGELHIADWK